MYSYCKVGEELKKQSMGIPMGMNASPFLSNLYLFMYELTFMKQFMVNKNSRKFLRDNFMCCVRFQDDSGSWLENTKRRQCTPTSNGERMARQPSHGMASTRENT